MNRRLTLRQTLAVAAIIVAGTANLAAAQGDGEERDRAPTTQGDGPYPAVMEVDPSLPGHVVYRPADLGPFAGGGLPVLAWGNGGCADDGAAHRQHLAQIASYGYLVIAPGKWRSGPGATAPREERQPLPGGRLPPPATSKEDVIAGIDWALAEDRRAGSAYHGRIARQGLAVGGHSCGGLQAIQLAGDPRIRTVLVHNSGIYNDGPGRIEGMPVSKDMLENFHTPVLYVLGGEADQAQPNGLDDFRRISRVPVVLADLPVGHGGTFGEPLGGAVAHVAVDWLEWQLRGDRVAARTFLGENCRLCSGTEWTLLRKGW